MLRSPVRFIVNRRPGTPNHTSTPAPRNSQIISDSVIRHAARTKKIAHSRASRPIVFLICPCALLAMIPMIAAPTV
jgi:hypothetical protein